MPETIYSNRQLRNDERNLKAIADGYETKLSHKYWLADALQKDAIQNGWDAKQPGKEWGMRFDLVQARKTNFLIIQDFHTTGLIGNTWKTQGELTSILENGDRKENLAHFLSSDFSTKNSESGGKRGRGKSLFLYFSKDSIFYFDSKQSTGDYVAGAIFIDVDKGAKVEMASRDQAVAYIKERVGGHFSPPSNSGTRIFIKNPREDVIEAVRNGSMLNFIEKTWWEIIKKHDANISIFDGLDKKRASVPDWYQEKIMQQRGSKTREYLNLIINSGEKEYRLKKIVLIYNPEGDIPESIQGISIQRNGMSIERMSTEALMKEKGMSKVYGWVEMEPELESSMYELEDVEHLGFIWTKKPAKDILDLIRINAYEFAKEVKLIEGELSKGHKAHRKIEDEIAKKINSFLKNLGFSGIALTKNKRRGKRRLKEIPLRISTADFKLYSERERRIDFGEKIKAIAIAINDLKISLPIMQRT